MNDIIKTYDFIEIKYCRGFSRISFKKHKNLLFLNKVSDWQ